MKANVAGRAPVLLALLMGTLAPTASRSCAEVSTLAAACAQAPETRDDSSPGAASARGPLPAPLAEGPGPQVDEQPETPSEAVLSETRALEENLRRARARRDDLLARLGRLGTSRSPVARVTHAWPRRLARAQLEDVVGELHRIQARLLELRARADALAEADVERQWGELESLVAQAAAAWRDGRGEEPELGPAIAAAFDRVGEPASRDGVRRYRELVGRLARVNGILARSEPGAASRVHAPQRAGVTPDPRSDFLGVMDRGAGAATDFRTSFETWKRLRDGLAGEIVATASEITRRVRESS